MVGTGKGAENGVLIKSGEALERAHEITAVVLDKTGTITEGRPEVTDVLSLGAYSQNQLLRLAASAERTSEHPLADAILGKAMDEGLELGEAVNFEAIVGRGIKAEVDGIPLLVGNQKLLTEAGIAMAELEHTADWLADEGKTPVYIAVEGIPRGIIAVADVIKKTSPLAVDKLYKLGLEVLMVTGDNSNTANAIAREAGIRTVLSDVLPEEKAAAIKRLQAAGHKVAMVGDGINDAPALAQADVGIAIGSGTDVAIESADIVLMQNDLLAVVTAIRLSRATRRNVKQNLFWAFGYNVIGIPVAAGALYAFGGPLLSPILGAAAMSLSSVSVVANALRLRNFSAEA
jgi:Cu+-exporting ATPase